MILPSRRFCSHVNHLALVFAGFALGDAVLATPQQQTAQAGFETEMLRTHNEERAFQGQQPLNWDRALASDAAKWARYLAETNSFEHASGEFNKKGQGENLWMGTRRAYSYAEMTSYWVAEADYSKTGKFPNVSKTGNWMDVGHYTQLIWPETHKIGCALESSAEDDFLVCRYWPAGNRLGDNFTVRARK